MNTAALIGFPLLASLLVWIFNSEQVKKVALGFSVIQLALAVYAFTKFKINADAQLMVDLVWIKSLGIHFKVAMDGISLLLVLLTNVLVPLIIFSSFNREIKNQNVFYALILLMQSALVGVFTAQDGFLFYIFWELALIPIWFICLLWGGENRARITFKFFVYTLTGSLLMLVGLIYVYLQTDNVILESGQAVARTFDIHALYVAGANLSSSEQTWIFWAMFIALAIKMPVFPFHTWQPDTYVVAPTQGTMLLSGIMLKMGTYGLIRWLLPLVPNGVQHWGNTAMILSIIGILYASIIAIQQKDFKRLIAYSSIAHVGLISAGIFSLTAQGIQGGIMQMLAHGINVVGLFFVADILFNRTKTNEISQLGGIRNIAPRFATGFMIVMLGSVALPITNGFVGEFLLLNGIYQYNAWFAAFAGLTVILGAVYMLRSYQRTMLGETNSLTSTFTDLSASEKIVFGTIVILIIAMGVYPKPLLDIAEPAVARITELIQPMEQL
ncbi:MAG: NADH-quinone oxidoreductase subunit M [Bacteroidetes bacterium]|nr:NADH-quinone oxidoreductase subunit M [Bacteroidota bacterium]